MTKRTTPILIHVAGASLLGGALAYAALRLLEPAPVLAPADSGDAAAVRPDAAQSGRLFGQVDQSASTQFNLQALGAYVAGRSSAAVVSIDGRRQRAVLLGQEIAPGAVLAEVRRDHIVLDQRGVRQSYPVPIADVAHGSATDPGFSREGNVLTAPSVEGAASAPGRPAGLPAAGADAAGPPVVPHQPPEMLPHPAPPLPPGGLPVGAVNPQLPGANPVTVPPGVFRHGRKDE